MQVLNHPDLVLPRGAEGADGDADEAQGFAGLVHEDIFPPDYATLDPSQSGKLQTLVQILLEMQQSGTGEKVVVVSNYTTTLTVVGDLLRKLGIRFIRLDGYVESTCSLMHPRLSLVDSNIQVSDAARPSVRSVLGWWIHSTK